MILFGRNYAMRRFLVSVRDGYEELTFSDSVFYGDIQNPSDKSEVNPEGGRREPRKKAWTDIPFTPDDQNAGAHADWIWDDRCWWKCVSCRNAKNTILSHYVSEFVRVPENEPDEYLAEPEVQYESV